MEESLLVSHLLLSDAMVFDNNGEKVQIIFPNIVFTKRIFIFIFLSMTNTVLRHISLYTIILFLK